MAAGEFDVESGLLAFAALLGNVGGVREVLDCGGSVGSNGSIGGWACGGSCGKWHR